MLGAAYIECAFVALGLTSLLDLAVQLHYDALPDPVWLGAIVVIVINGAASQARAIAGVSGVDVDLRQSFRCLHSRN